MRSLVEIFGGTALVIIGIVLAVLWVAMPLVAVATYNRLGTIVDLLRRINGKNKV